MPTPPQKRPLLAREVVGCWRKGYIKQPLPIALIRRAGGVHDTRPRYMAYTESSETTGARVVDTKHSLSYQLQAMLVDTMTEIGLNIEVVSVFPRGGLPHNPEAPAEFYEVFLMQNPNAYVGYRETEVGSGFGPTVMAALVRAVKSLPPRSKLKLPIQQHTE